MILPNKNIEKYKSIDYILEKFAYKHPYLFFYLIFVGMPICALIAVVIGTCTFSLIAFCD